MNTRNWHQKNALQHVGTLRETLSTSIIVWWIPLIKIYWKCVPFQNTFLVMNFSLFYLKFSLIFILFQNYLYILLYAHCEKLIQCKIQYFNILFIWENFIVYVVHEKRKLKNIGRNDAKKLNVSYNIYYFFKILFLVARYV